MSAMILTRISCDYGECPEFEDFLTEARPRAVPLGWGAIDVRSHRAEHTVHYCRSHFLQVQDAIPGFVSSAEREYGTLEDMGDETKLGGIDAG